VPPTDSPVARRVLEEFDDLVQIGAGGRELSDEGGNGSIAAGTPSGGGTGGAERSAAGPRFVKVMPTDYRRVLNEQAAAAAVASSNGDGPHEEPAAVGVSANGDGPAEVESVNGERFSRGAQQEPR